MATASRVVLPGSWKETSVSSGFGRSSFKSCAPSRCKKPLTKAGMSFAPIVFEPTTS